MTAPESLRELFIKTFGAAPAKITPLAGAGSSRQYFRIESAENLIPKSVIGTVGTNLKENNAFIALSQHFAILKLHTPKVLAVSDDRMFYLQEDLGDLSLFNAIKSGREGLQFSTEEVNLLEKTMELLAEIQYTGAENLDWKVCFPQEAMDSNMIKWDFNYFKYCFLKPLQIDFSEHELEAEFGLLHDDLLERANSSSQFMIRDFQSRNVMIRDSKPYCIDYQGGRRGPVEYDVASFLWQSKAAFPDALRRHLIDKYINAVKTSYSNFDEQSFRQSLPKMVLFRMLQTAGAYGLRGLSEKKPHFLSSIPIALENLTNHIRHHNLESTFPCLTKAIVDAANTQTVKDLAFQASIPSFDGLTVTVTSFSYKRGFPYDLSGNGGGYAFDCRAILNPGRYEPYKHLTGRDESVIKFLEKDGGIFDFLKNAWGMTDNSIEYYLKRGFTSLCINFGCTGGQHRSVYSAESTARHITSKYPSVRVVLWHREQGISEVIEPSET